MEDASGRCVRRRFFFQLGVGDVTYMDVNLTWMSNRPDSVKVVINFLKNQIEPDAWTYVGKHPWGAIKQLLELLAKISF